MGSEWGLVTGFAPITQEAKVAKSLKNLVPGEGVEPSRPCGQRILSPLRLPIPPPRPVIESHTQACAPF
jgi:hypothetical protein